MQFFNEMTNNQYNARHSLSTLLVVIISVLSIFLSLTDSGQCFSFTYNAGEKTQMDIDSLRKAAKKGDTEAQYILASKLDQGIRTRKNDREAAFWFEKAAAQNYWNAAYAIGHYYTIGRGVPRDYIKALKWLERSAATDNNQAYYLLGGLYASGKGVKKDPIMAAIYKRKDDGITDTELRDSNKGLEWGDKPPIVRQYGNDIFIPEKMIQHLQAEADYGDPTSQFNLGFAIYRGSGTIRDSVRALHWFECSAAQNNIAAIFISGMMYEYGSGTKQNEVKAVEFYSKAADKNDYDALVRLGHCYEKGIGVARDLVKAQVFYLLADKQKEGQIPGWAISYSDKLSKHLSRSQREAASKTAAEWMQKRQK